MMQSLKSIVLSALKTPEPFL